MDRRVPLRARGLRPHPPFAVVVSSGHHAVVSFPYRNLVGHQSAHHDRVDSWKSVVEQERQDAAYRAFVAELHRRIAAAPARARFQTGSPAIIYWLGAGVCAAAALALVILTLRALQMRDWAGAALVGEFMVLFAWQIGTFFWRNLPGSYRPDALPAQVLPRP